MLSHAVTSSAGDHNPVRNRRLQVSAERVVWTALRVVLRNDVPTRSTSEIEPPSGLRLTDVPDDVELFEGENPSLVLRVRGRAEERYPDLEPVGRLGPSGDYALAIEETGTRHAAAVIDTRTGELWRVPGNH